jgi:ribonuclease HII
MTWFIGIDEAGYGPNLGPFVMTAVACRVPKGLAGTDLWSVLRRVVRRQGETKRLESRIFVADSKVVYSPKRGLKALENGVLATLLHEECEPPATLDQLLERFAYDARTELHGEPWYTGTTPLPFAVTAGAVRVFAEQFQRLCRSQDIQWAPARVCAVCPPRFNRIVAESGTKGEVSGRALQEVLSRLADLPPENENVRVLVDKHGGRNHYAALLQEAFPDSMVMVQCEGMDRSQYEVFGLGRQVRFTFEPRADSAHFCVALASMISKYLREMLMHEFNAFWQTHVPGLQPTAGYPVDASRYWKEIQPAAERLGMEETAIWRRR